MVGGGGAAPDPRIRQKSLMYFLPRCRNGYNLSLRPDISLMGKGREQRETERKEGRGKDQGKRTQTAVSDPNLLTYGFVLILSLGLGCLANLYRGICIPKRFVSSSTQQSCSQAFFLFTNFMDKFIKMGYSQVTEVHADTVYIYRVTGPTSF
jgi:hypothetical protein